MNDAELLELFRQAMEEVVDAMPATVELDARIADLGVDSLSLVEIVMILEERLDVASEADDFEDVTTIRDAVAVFAALVDKEAQHA